MAGLPAYEVSLVDGGHQGVGSIYHVTHVKPPYLGQELVGIQPREPMLALEPADEFRVGYASSILHRPCAPHSHELVLRLDTGPLYAPALDHLEGNRDLARYLQRDPAELSLALPGVAVTSVEQRPLVPHGQVHRVAGPHVRYVHVAPEGTGRERRDGLEVGRHRDSSDEWLPWHPDPDLFVHQVAAPVVFAKVPHVDLLGERLLQGACERGRGQAAEVRDVAADGVVPLRLDALHPDDQRVPRLCPLNVYGPCLRVEELGGGECLAW